MDEILFRATPDQVKQLAANAVMRSQPMGMGFMHYDSKHKFEPSKFEIDPKRGLHLDYVAGRMVKLNIFARGENTWAMRDQADTEYQSWAGFYPTATDLLKSVDGVEIVKA